VRKTRQSFPFEKLQAFDEDTVNQGRNAEGQGRSSCERDPRAVSRGDMAEDIEPLRDDTEALLSCPHANPNVRAKTHLPGIQPGQLAQDMLPATALKAIALPE
jgi:hypothetical protein